MATALAPLSEAELARHVGNVAKDGYTIMEDAIPQAFRTEIVEEIERLEAVRPGGDIPPAPFTGQVTRRWFDVLNDGEVWQRVAIHPWILQVQQAVLGEGFLLSTMGTAVVGDGEPAQPIHVDDGVYAFPRPHPNLVCNTMWALTEFTEATGATRIVPGSHLWDRDPEPGGRYPSIGLEMPQGGIGVVLGSTFHGAGANASGRDRLALTINYCNGSMRQQENLMLGVSPERMMSFPRALQDILGFKVCKGAGHIFAQDPRSQLQAHFGGRPTDDAWLDERNALHAERIARSAPRRRAS